MNDFVRSQFVTSRMVNLFTGQEGGARYLPYAFTEQGIYMLMTVLRGPLAVRQSRTLVMLFKKMKDYILENQELLGQREQLKMMMAAMGNTKKVTDIEREMAGIDKRLTIMEKKAEEVVMRSEISPIMLDFNKMAEQKEYVFLNGEPMRASELYIDIYARARKSIYIIDDYISIKTLSHLRAAKAGVEVTIFSDNKGKYLSKNDYMDFVREFPEVKIKFMRTGGVVHDRFIIVDYGTENETVYHCGASEKDAGGKIMAINKFEDGLVRTAMGEVVERLKDNDRLVLR